MIERRARISAQMRYPIAILIVLAALVCLDGIALAGSTYTPPRSFSLPTSDPDVIPSSLISVMSSRAGDSVIVADRDRGRLVPISQPNEGYFWLTPIIPKTVTFYSKQSRQTVLGSPSAFRTTWETDLDLALDEVRSRRFTIAPAYETLTQAEVDRLPSHVYYTGEIVDERTKALHSRKNFLVAFFYDDQEFKALDAVARLARSREVDLQVESIEDYLVILMVRGRQIAEAFAFIRANSDVYVTRARFIKSMMRAFGLLGSQAQSEQSNAFEGVSLPHWTPLDLCIVKAVLTAGQYFADTELRSLDFVAERLHALGCPVD